MAKDLSRFEEEFIKFCKRICPQNCDLIELKSGETRTDVIIETCPIIIWEKHLCEREGLDVDIKQRVEDMMLSGKWKRLRR